LASVLFEPASKLKRVSPNSFQGCKKVQIIDYPPSVKFEVDSEEQLTFPEF